ncbi:MAG: hypothetical protein DMD91_27030 [Candidatus Rokuibacteriota bacterium]|nr:MAG: hypothetical protein DMD91_27030 [Candidatus Rokubacteria bacterium]
MKVRSLALAGVGGILLQVGLVCSTAHGQIETPGVSIQVSGGRMTAQLKNAPLKDVLAVLARQTGITVVVHPPAVSGERLTIDVRRLPVEEGVRRILRNTNALFVYSSLTLQAVHVYGQSVGASQSRPVALPTPAASGKAMDTDRTADEMAAADATAALLDARITSLRKRAATTLGDTYDASAIGPLAQALSQDDDATVRLSVVKAMGRLRSEQAVASLAGALSADPDLDVRRGARRPSLLSFRLSTRIPALSSGRRRPGP